MSDSGSSKSASSSISQTRKEILAEYAKILHTLKEIDKSLKKAIDAQQGLKTAEEEVVKVGQEVWSNAGRVNK